MAVPDVAVRAARPSDREDLARLSTELGYGMTPSEAEAQLATLSGHPDHALLVAEADGRLAGWIQVSVSRIFESPATAEIAGLVVGEGLRGAGVGRTLLSAAQEWARERRCGRLRVRSNVVRERAHRFYEREGFQDVKTQRVLEKAL